MNEYDVVVIGGGAAGLSAALVLSRARRKVAVVDGGAPRNAPASHMHGFLSRDGLPPNDLLAAGREEVRRYGGEIIDGTVADVPRGAGPGFQVLLADGRRLTARRVLVATGLRDELPDIPGVRERWGRDVLHCPYCHGYEVRDQQVGVLDGAADSVQHAQLVRQWASDVVLFPHTGTLTADQREQLASRAIGIVDGTVKRLLIEDDQLCGVELDDGRAVRRAAVFVRPRFVPNSDLLVGLGCAVDDTGWVIADATGGTSVPGVWVAGNATNPRAQVITAAGEGSAAAVALNADLVEEDIKHAVRDLSGGLRPHAAPASAARPAGHVMSPHTDSGHGHDHTDVDWEVMAAQLENSGELQLPVLRRTAARLRELLDPEKEVRRILDIGSGPGVMTCVLAETFTDAEAVAVDGAPGLLDRAVARAERLGLGGRVTVRHAQLPERLDGGDEHGEGGLGSADLVWSSKTVHHLGDQQGALNQLAGVLRPGGLLAVAEGGLPMRFLPRDIGIGRPGLQARLDVAQERWFEIMRAELPGSTTVVEDWLAMLSRAGLTGVGSFASLLDLPAPLGETARAFLHAHLTRLRETVSESLDVQDRRTVDVLLDPEAPEGILRRPDAFLLSATTVFTGVRSAR